jgi:tyrosyl-tRNA synthetase
MESYFTLLTDLDQTEIESMMKAVSEGKLHPMEAKKRLARELVSRFHGQEAARQAERSFKEQVQEKKVPEDVPWVSVPPERAGEITVVELALMAGLAGSKMQVRRLIDQGGVELDGVRVTDRDTVTAVRDGMLLRVGKRRFARFKVG